VGAAVFLPCNRFGPGHPAITDFAHLATRMPQGARNRCQKSVGGRR
jgi:hypothetical protein